MSENLVFKSDFFNDDFKHLLNNIEHKWVELEAKFEYLCKRLKTRRQKNVFIIDGSIAAGKTTLLNNILKKCPNKSVNIVCEPVDVWQSIGICKYKDQQEQEFINVLNLFYLARTNAESPFYLFLFQVIVLVSRVVLMVQVLEECTDESIVIIFERHPMSDKIFFALSKHLMETSLVNKYERLINYVDIDIPRYKWLFVGMNIEPKHYKRCIDQHIYNMKKRNRSEENVVPYDYVEALYYQYTRFILNDLLTIEKWVLDYETDEHAMCDRAIKILTKSV